MARTVKDSAEPVILFEEDPSLLTTVIDVVVLTGGADDPTDKSGLTNLMSELMLRGTKKRSRSKFQNDIEKMGASLSARTAHDAMLFSGKVIKENTDEFLKLIEDFMLNPAFSEKEFKALQTETIGEIAHKKNQNQRLAGLALRRTLFEGTSFERPVEGGVRSVKAVQLGDITKRYNDRVHRANVIFAVASPFPLAKMKPKLTEFWAKLPDGARLTRKSVTPKVPSQPTIVLTHKPDTSAGSILMGQTGITAQDPDRYTLNAANFSFGGEPLVSRLFKVIRSELGWTYSIGATYNALGNLSHQQGLYVISATPSIEYTVKTVFKGLAMWENYLEEGLRSEEASLSKESNTNSYPFEFDSAEKRLGQKVHSYLYGTPILTQEELTQKLQSISNSDIKKALREHHKPKGWLISIVADQKVLEAQLEAEQKDVPKEERLKISKVYTPDEIIQ